LWHLVDTESKNLNIIWSSVFVFHIDHHFISQDFNFIIFVVRIFTILQCSIIVLALIHFS
jgi:hypothetical protein